MSSITSRISKWSMIYFEILLALSQISGFLLIILAAYVLNMLGDGIAWANPKYGFQNFHGLFMTIGLVFFQGEALLSYRLYRYDAKMLSKFVHVVFHVLAIGFFSTALAAAILQKNAYMANPTHFSTIHSWVGIIVMFIYVVQFCFGAISFLIPGMGAEAKASFMPLHRIVGSISFLLCCIQAVIGHVQFMTFAANGPMGCYYLLDCQTHLDYMFNFSIIALLVYCIAVLVIVVPPIWRREKTPEEMK